jgi:RNA polymerase sigma factor (sigma-70 family)
LSTALAQAPPADATRLLYERHSSRIFGFCLSRLGSREEAEDALQTTFLNAQRGLGRGVVPDYELAWLFKIAQNVCHNRHQSARRRGRLEAAHDLDALQDVIATPERGGAVSLNELTRALGAIPERQRRALLLREFQGYSYDEIASELGISVAAVETLLFRARRAVAVQLERSGALSRPKSGATAMVVELFRWLFGGAAAPLKLAAVTAVVATTATVSLVPAIRGREPAAPVRPEITKVGAVAPASTATHVRTRAAKASHAATSPRGVVQGPAATLPASAVPHVEPPGAAAPGSERPKSTASPAPEPALEPVTTATPAPVVPELTVPALGVPAVSVPVLPLPAVTVPELEPSVAVELPKLP